MIGSSVTLGTPVLFPLNQMFGGAGYNKTFRLQAQQTFVTDGTNAWVGSDYSVTPAGGTNPIVQLTPNIYLVIFQDGKYPWRIQVPNSNAQLNALALTVGTVPSVLFTATTLVNNATGTNVNLSGSFAGDGSGLTNVAVTIPDSVVQTNQASAVTLTNDANSFAGSFAGDGVGLTNLDITSFRYYGTTNMVYQNGAFDAEFKTAEVFMFYPPQFNSVVEQCYMIDDNGLRYPRTTFSGYLADRYGSIGAAGTGYEFLTADGQVWWASTFNKNFLSINGDIFAMGGRRIADTNGNLYATIFTGNGLNLTNLQGANITGSLTNNTTGTAALATLATKAILATNSPYGTFGSASTLSSNSVVFATNVVFPANAVLNFSNTEQIITGNITFTRATNCPPIDSVMYLGLTVFGSGIVVGWPQNWTPHQPNTVTMTNGLIAVKAYGTNIFLGTYQP